MARHNSVSLANDVTPKNATPRSSRSLLHEPGLLSPYQAKLDNDEAPVSNNPASAASGLDYIAAPTYRLQASYNHLEISETQLSDVITTDIEDIDMMEDTQFVDQCE